MKTATHPLPLLIASIGLLLIAQPGLASEGTEPLEAPATQTESAPAVESDVDLAEALPDVSEADAVDTPTQTDPPVVDSQPIDMDRSTWPTLVVTPTDGSVTHNPSYMGNPPMGDDIVTPLHAPETIWQIQEALGGADAGNLNGENLTALGAQPFIGLAQFVLIPVRVVFENPLSDATSP